MGTPSVGHSGRLYVASADTFNEAYPFLSESLVETPTHNPDRGISGRPTQRSERITEATLDIAGDIAFEPTPAEFDVWLPRFMGGSKIGNDIKLAATVPAWDGLINKVGDLHQFNDLKVNQATIRAAAGENVGLTLSLLGKTMTLPVSEPDVAITDAAPYVFHEGVLLIGGSTREVEEISLVVNRKLAGSRRFSKTMTHLNEGDIEITASPVLPFTEDEVAVLALGVTGATLNLTFTKGAQSLVFACSNVKFSGAGPAVGSRDGEILYSPSGIVFSTTDVTNDDNALIVTSTLS